ncbi:MAG TPA: hypothetical protein ENJ33_08385 [Thiothrix sp.]|nr:hypothetical protein [Thiothrix sp.]
MQTNIVKIFSIILGLSFGFLLVSVGATNYNVQKGMFLFDDFTLPIVLSTAMMSGMIGTWVIRRIKARSLIKQEEIDYPHDRFSKRLLLGTVAFGLGWALTASCPGTAFIMIGEGKMTGIPVIIGILAGTWLFGLYNVRSRKTS